MPKKTPESFNYLSNDPEFVPDPEIEEFMEEEIAHAPKDPNLLAQRLRNHAASPADAGAQVHSKESFMKELAITRTPSACDASLLIGGILDHGVANAAQRHAEAFFGLD